MKKLLVAALVMLPFSSGAVEDKEIVICAAEKNIVLRLACFDDLASKHSLAPSSTDTTKKEEAGEWITKTHTDPMNDKAVYTAVLPASSGQGRYGGLLALYVRCADNATEMYINWSSYLGNKNIKTTYRIDKDAAQTSSWSLSTNNKSAFFPGSPVSTLKRLSDSSSFVANVTPYNESPVTAVFNTTGADKALADIRKGCNW